MSRQLLGDVTDGVCTSGDQMRAKIEEVLSSRENFIFGVGMGKAGCNQLEQIGIPGEMIRDVSRGVGLAAIFREFTTMTTQGAWGLSPVRHDLRTHPLINLNSIRQLDILHHPTQEEFSLQSVQDQVDHPDILKLECKTTEAQE